MKKPKSWIRACVQLLLFIVFGGQTLEFHGNPVTDDIVKINILRQNIPKDYRIPVRYIPKEEGDMCWVKLNIFYVEESLEDLSHKFGNISNNRKDISIIVTMLQDSRIKMGQLDIMLDFECLYREELWATARYFDYVKDFLTEIQQLKEFVDDCEPPPCPTTQQPSTTTMKEFRDSTESMSGVCPLRNCQPEKQSWFEVFERSLFSLLFIPLLAIILLLVWKLRSRRSAVTRDQARAEDGLFAGPEGGAAPLDADVSETNQLTVEVV